MNILVVGSGGREHALAWKLAEPETVERVYVTPGNAGTALEPKLENVPLDPMDIEGLAKFAREQGCALTVIGPEAPLVAGIVDRFAELNLPCLAPPPVRRNWRAANPLPRIFSRGTTSPLHPMRCLPTSRRL